MKPVKVTILHPHFTLAGGAGNFVLEVSNRLADSGFEITIICIKANSEIVGNRNPKVQIIELGGAISSSLKHWILLPIFLTRLVLQCRQLRPDILFPQVFPANWWGFIAKPFLARTKTVWMCQEPSAFIHSKSWIAAIRNPLMHFILIALNPILKLIDRWLARNVDYVFTNSHYTANYARDIYGYNNNQLASVYLGVSEAFQHAPNRNFEQRRNQFITIGRLTKFKNVDLLIRAVADLRDRKGLLAHLKIVGKGEEEETLRSLCSQLKLDQQVHFCGALTNSELVNELADSRAFVLASVNEPFGLVVVEALACGTPAIVVATGGPAEIVQDRICGHHIPARDFDQLTQHLERLLTDQDEFTKMSLAARIRAADFDWGKTASIIGHQFLRLRSETASPVCDSPQRP